VSIKKLPLSSPNVRLTNGVLRTEVSIGTRVPPHTDVSAPAAVVVAAHDASASCNDGSNNGRAPPIGDSGYPAYWFFPGHSIPGQCDALGCDRVCHPRKMRIDYSGPFRTDVSRHLAFPDRQTSKLEFTLLPFHGSHQQLQHRRRLPGGRWRFCPWK
jgi:hypothetical protein